MLIPENELGVIVRFAREAHHHGFEIASIGIAFPDAIISKDGHTYRAEFEFAASSFEAHGHDHRKCDLIICWTNDNEDCILPILALSEPEWMHTDLTLPNKHRRESYYWRHRALKAERALKSMKKKEEEANGPGGPYVCEICGKAFAKRNALNGHMNKHRGEGAT